MDSIMFNSTACPVVKLLGKGKGGYSWLVQWQGRPAVLKQIHHEPCSYYTFGNKLQSELNDYRRLTSAGIPVPKLIGVDEAGERILKTYVEGPTVMELLRSGESVERYLPAVRRMARRAEAHGLNIDYFPTNFVADGDELWYIDYECNAYMEEWSFERWGVKYWSRTPELEAYWSEHGV